MNYVLCLSEMRMVPVLPVALSLSTECLVLSPCWMEQTPDSPEPTISGQIDMNEPEDSGEYLW